MAVIFMDGFDTYNGTGAAPTGLESRWIKSGGGTLVAGRFASGQALSTASETFVSSTFTAVSSFTFACGFYIGSLNDAVNFLSRSGATAMAGLRFDATGIITGVRNTTVLGSSAAGVIAINVWYTLEVEIVISDTVGRITVYIDGTQVLNLTGVDTRNGVPTTIDNIRVGNNNIGGNITRWDDVYVIDSATKLTSAFRIETLYPTSDGATLNWTPSTGTDHFAVVDEATASMTDYISASTVGDVDELNLGNLASSPTSIEAVQVTGYALKTDATARTIYLGVKSGATTSDGSAFTLSQTGGRHDRLLLTDPNTAAAWTTSAVDALIVRPKVAS